MSTVRIRPSVLPGRPAPPNQGAIAWGCHGLVAYACHSCVLVIDVVTVDTVQTLDGHVQPVSALCWAHDNIGGSAAQVDPLRIVSGDTAGTLLLWAVSDGRCLVRFADTTTSGKPVLSLVWHPEEDDLFMSLHTGGILTLWNARSAIRLWKLETNANIDYVAFNTFDSAHMSAAMSDGSVYFVSGINASTAPLATAVQRKYRVTNTQPTPAGKKPDDIPLRQIQFSPHNKNVMLFVLPREVMIFNIVMHQSIASLSLDSSRPAFSKVFYVRSHPNALLCFHEDGAVSVWYSRDGVYSLQLFTDLLRTNFHAKATAQPVLSVSQSPIDETRFSLVNEEGRVWLWEIALTSPPKATLHGLTGAVSGAYSSVAVLSEGIPQVAVGTRGGLVQLFDLSSGQLTAEHIVHQSVVRGVRWESPCRLLSFAYQQAGQTTYANEIALLDLRDGRKTVIRETKDESTLIRGIRLSNCRQYMIVLLKERPAEIWDMRRHRLLQTAFQSDQITAMEWSPLEGDMPAAGPPPMPVKEQFVVAGTDGTLRHFVIQDGIITQSPKAYLDLQTNVVCSMAWKNDVLVCGDTIGTMYMWNFRSRKSSTLSTHRGLVRRIRFAPGTSPRALVLFGDGDVGVWDFSTGQAVALKATVKGRDLRAADVGWADADHPVVATTDGCVRILLSSLACGQSPVDVQPVGTAALLSAPRGLYVKSAMFHGLIPQMQDDYAPDDWPMMTPELADEMRSCPSAVQRCLLTSTYLGNESEIQFWTLARHYLARFAICPPAQPLKRVVPPDSPIVMTALREDLAASARADLPPLPLFLDYLRESSDMRTEGSRTATLFESRRGESEELKKQTVEEHTKLGQRDKSLQLLLEIPPDKSISYRDALMACVTAAAMSQQTFQNTVKLVATNFIAAGQLDEGVQLLCAIGRSLDACRYLQADGRWKDSAWLAKIALNEADAADILKRYADHLKQCRLPMKAANILVSLGQFRETLRLLHTSGLSELAAMFIVTCEEANLMHMLHTEAPSSDGSVSTPVAQPEDMVKTVFSQYTEYLERIGHSEIARQYAERANRRGSSATSPPASAFPFE
eukprot:TRINITY_DN8678_c0_g1_i1.p1 TRINITY_DN8678_c0_g1~~TRINITY_DN8678_c0_g1_i1.p1  ORF type:complete len:1078 (-),score=210.28 TRINITY_DN8678_c0_g1_i1:854-4087(-)